LLPVDAINAMRSTARSLALDDDEVAEVLVRTRRGYHRAVAGLASAGNDVIMDYPLSEQWRVEDLLNVLQGYDVTLVEIRCAHDELLRREQGRSDRPIGLAQSQSGLHALG
jgi:chloramphenicol 3-O phosphotransferase